MNFMTTITTFLSVLFAFFTQIAQALPVSESSLEKRDVFVPPVLYPHAETEWFTGQRHNVTWDVSNAPQNITNGRGLILLRAGDFTTPLILANDFDILLGRIEVTVPWVAHRTDYSVVLFGDSGNFSPQFEIIGTDLF